jgi:hypothetical protein
MAAKDSTWDKRIGWAPDIFAASVQDVCIDDGRSHIGVAPTAAVPSSRADYTD